MSTVEEPILIDIEEMEESHVTQHNLSSDDSKYHWIYVLIGSLLGAGIMVTAGVLGWMYKKKRGCWARAGKGKMNKTMPIGLSNSIKKEQ